MSQQEDDDNKSMAPPRIVVNDPPKFDLESYIANYEGLTRVDRLILIGNCSRYLGADALRLGIKEALQRKNIQNYEHLVHRLSVVAPGDLLAKMDDGWLALQKKNLRAEGDRLESELKSYKNNLIKESIRMGNEDLGQFYYETGDYATSFKAYARMREYCVTPKQISEMTLKLVLVAVAQKNWMAVSANIFKLPSLQLKQEEKDRIDPLIMPLRGLVSLSTDAYRDAARAFLAADPLFINMEPVAGIAFNKQVLTGNDVAIYGGLCALATMTRIELQKEVVENANFRTFIELEPHIRRAVNCFCGAKYSQCLAILESYRTDYLLDIFLQQHVQSLYSQIRRKSIVAYFMPFSRASIDSMAAAFSVTAQEMERECLEMIKEGSLNARLDPVIREVVAKGSNPRTEVLQKALTMAEEQEKAMRLKMFKINMQAAGFEVRPPKQAPALKEPPKSGGMLLGRWGHRDH